MFGKFELRYIISILNANLKMSNDKFYAHTNCKLKKISSNLYAKNSLIY